MPELKVIKRLFNVHKLMKHHLQDTYDKQGSYGTSNAEFLNLDLTT